MVWPCSPHCPHLPQLGSCADFHLSSPSGQTHFYLRTFAFAVPSAWVHSPPILYIWLLLNIELVSSSQWTFPDDPSEVPSCSSLVPLIFLHSTYRYLEGFCLCIPLLILLLVSPTAVSALRADSGYFVFYSVLEPFWHKIGTQYLVQ